MPTPPKPYLVLASEKKSHRTKKELTQREEGEKSLTSGTALKERPEVARNPMAHEEFIRISELLDSIEKSDALYEPIINRYCMMQAECYDLQIKREKIYETAFVLEKKLEELGVDADFEDLRKVVNDIACIYATMIACDKQVESKRKMLLSIEKENIMTIAAALRSIPKKEENKGNALRDALNG